LESLESLHQNLPELRSVDVGYNHISQRDEALTVLSGLDKLRNLVMAGNPCTMVPFYRRDIVGALGGVKGEEQLRWLDDMTISTAEREGAQVERIEEQRLAPLQFTLFCDTIESLERLNEELPGEGELEPPEGPWSKGGEGAPPKPTLSHGYYVEIDFMGQKLRSRVIPSEEPAGVVQLTLPDQAPVEGEEAEAVPDGEAPLPTPMTMVLDNWIPSVEGRDAVRGKGVEAHLVRASTFSSKPHEAFYAALPVAEGASEEEIAEKRKVPEDVTQETLLRVTTGELAGVLDGLSELQIESKMFSGKVVQNARLDNWGIMCENVASLNTDNLQGAPQMLKMRLQVQHNWVDPNAIPEPEPEPEEEPAKGKKK